jgi:PAS domain S-box-containing protein
MIRSDMPERLRLAAIVQFSQDAIVSANVRGEIVTWNPAAERLFGYTAEQAIGQPIFVISPPECHAEARQFLESVRRGEPVLNRETLRLRRDGVRIPVAITVSPLADSTGEIFGSSATLRDLAPLRRAEAARRETEERYEFLFRTMKQGVINFDAERRVISANPAAERAFGRESSEMLGLRLSDLTGYWLHATGAPLSPENSPILAAIRTGAEVRGFVLGFADARSQTHWVSIDAFPRFRPGEQEPYQVFSIAQDITELKNATDSLRAQNELLETILDRVPVFISMLGPDGRIKFVNREWRRLFGWALNKDGGLDSVGRTAPNPDVRRQMNEWLSSPTGDWRDFTQLLEDGRTIQTSWAHVHLSDGSLLCFGLDVSARAEAEALRRADAQRLRLLVQHGYDVISVVDERSTILFVSSSVERVMGYPADAVTGSQTLDYVHPDDLTYVEQVLQTVLSGPSSSATARFRIRHSDGSWRHAECAATNALHVPGLNGIVVNLRDCTERYRFEQQLRESERQLRLLAAHIEDAREQERTRIARDIHDNLGQMLSVLKLDLAGLPLQHRFENPASQEAFEGEVAAMLGRVDSTIDTVRRISAELRPGILDHVGLPAALRWQLHEFTSRTGLRSTCSGLNQELKLPAGHATAVFRIFQEILTNILRHAAASSITVRLRADGGWLTLRVADDGKGIDLKRLSDPDALGIVGMRERARIAGGEVRFAAGRRGGTVVTVHIPMLEPIGSAEPPVAVAELPSGPLAHPPRILLVDDHAVFRNELKAVLAQTWPEALFGEAGDGSAALQAALSGSWDIIILDLSMPGKSGLAVLHELRIMRPALPVLVLSMHAEPAYAEAARQAGARGYVAKSNSPAHIATAVALILAGGNHFPT